MRQKRYFKFIGHIPTHGWAPEFEKGKIYEFFPREGWSDSGFGRGYVCAGSHQCSPDPENFIEVFTFQDYVKEAKKLCK